MRRAVRPIVIVAVIAALVLVDRRFDVFGHMTVDGMRALVDAHAPYGPLVFIGVCVFGIFLHMPEIVLIAIGGVVFGGVRAFVYGWIGALVGTTATFVLVRYVAHDTFQRSLAGRFARLRALEERLARRGFATVLALRLVLFLAPPVNWTLGATRVRLQHYVAGTALGVIPGIATTVFFADSIANRPSGTSVVSPKIAIAALLVAVLLAAATVASRRFFRPSGTAPPG